MQRRQRYVSGRTAVDIRRRPTDRMAVAVGQSRAESAQSNRVGMGTRPVEQRSVAAADEDRHSGLHGSRRFEPYICHRAKPGCVDGSARQQLAYRRCHAKQILDALLWRRPYTPGHFELSRCVTGADTQLRATVRHHIEGCDIACEKQRMA